MASSSHLDVSRVPPAARIMAETKIPRRGVSVEVSHRVATDPSCLSARYPDSNRPAGTIDQLVSISLLEMLERQRLDRARNNGNRETSIFEYCIN